MPTSGRITFFVDNNLSRQLADGMRAFGESVTHLQDHFPEDTIDEVWLQFVGRNGHVLVSRDYHIRIRPAELKAFRSYKVGAFFLGGKNRTRCELIQQLVRNWPRIKEFAQKTKPPYAFRVPPSGTKFDTITV